MLRQFSLCLSLFLLSIPQGQAAVNSFYGIGALNPLVQVDDTSGAVTLNIYAGSERVATVAVSGSNITPSYLHKDHLSSTTLVTDSSASMLAAFDYEPYGQSTAYGDNTSNVIYRFSSEHYESETGLYNYHARLYSPTTGTFGAIDPAGKSISPYTAFNQNPVNFRDLNGQLPTPPGFVKVFHFIADNRLATSIRTSGLLRPYAEMLKHPEFKNRMQENVSSLPEEQRFNSTFWTALDINKDIYSEHEKYSWVEMHVDPTQSYVYNMLLFNDPEAHARSRMRLDNYLESQKNVTGQRGRLTYRYEPTHASTRDPMTGEVLWYEKDSLQVVEEDYKGDLVRLKGSKARSVKNILAAEDSWVQNESSIWRGMVRSAKSSYVSEHIRLGVQEVRPEQVYLNEKRSPVDVMEVIDE